MKVYKRNSVKVKELKDIVISHPSFKSLESKEWFLDWLSINIKVYNAFEKLSIQLKNNGKRDKYSGWAIVQKMRWDTLFQETKPSDFRINNNCIAYLTRLVMIYNPSLKGMFRTKEKKIICIY